MRFNEFNEGIDPSAKAAIKGMRELSGDQYYGLYKTMKDVAGHDGKKQTAPEGKTDHEVSDKPFAYAYTDEEKNMIKGVDPKAKQITSDKSEEVKEGYYDLPNQDSFPGMEPIDFSSNPSFKELVTRYTQLVYQGHAGETSPEEDQEYDEIEQYVAQRFGEKGSAHLQKAGEVSYWGRDDKPYGRDSRSSNLGRPNQPGGNFRTTKAGKMHGQDAKMMKAKVADRLGRHPEPNLPEAYEPVDRPYGAYRSGIFSPNRGIARRSLTAVNKFLEKPFNSHQKRTDFLLDLVPDRNLKEIVGVLAYEHFPFDDLREKPWFMRRLNSLIARAERKLNQDATESVEEGAVEGEDDPWGDGHSRGSAAGTMNAPHSKYPEGSEDHKLYMIGYKQGVKAYNNKVKQYKKSSKEQGVAEGTGGIGNKIKALYQKIHDQGDDAIEFMYNDSPIFAQYWDEYEGDLDSIIAEIDPSELQVIYSELESAAEDQGITEAGNNYHANRTGFSRGPRDDERHDLDVARPTIYALKINGKVWKKDGNVVTFFTKERALAARNSILHKRPELEVGLVQRQD